MSCIAGIEIKYTVLPETWTELETLMPWEEI